ncbi:MULTISPECIES: SDR family oxidoreductase [Pseudoalteromonas]|uniref:SDR family oxidoreductase n=1 Tax=Pseudoalteromonas TaxID=53246 RepID=UPI000C2D481E|nr:MULTISPECIES: SDR family oxidoreductase [Pseudoalteromonas]
MRNIATLQDLTGTWALITGGAGHVGTAAADTLLELGCNVILLDRDQTLLERALSSLHFAHGKNVFSVQCDLACKQSIHRAVDEVADISSNKLNVLINNAAFVGTDELKGWAVPFEQQDINTFDDCLNVNLSAPFLLAQKCIPLFKNTDSPLKSIVNVSSIYALVGPQMAMYEGTNLGNPAAYAASKAGLMQLTTWLSSVVAPTIRVNNLVLGGIFRNQDSAFLAQYTARVPLARMATEEDVKGAFAYLCSQMSNYMTGQSIVLDGGWTAI